MGAGGGQFSLERSALLQSHRLEGGAVAGVGVEGFTPPRPTCPCHASRTWPIIPNLASRHGKNDSSFHKDGR